MSLTIDHDYDTALIEGLRHPRPDIAETCAWVLGQRRTRRAVPALIAVLHERPNEIDVQAAAVIALGRIGDPGAFPALVEAAQSGPVRVRRAALERSLTWTQRAPVPFSKRSPSPIHPRGSARRRDGFWERRTPNDRCE